MLIRRVVTAASVGVAMFVAVTVAPAALADTEPANGLAPGFTVKTYSADDRTSSICTAGFIAYNPKNTPIMLTAGHCDQGGGLRLLYAGTGNWEWVGSFLVNMYRPPFDSEDRDIGAVPLKNIAIPFSAQLWGNTPVRGYTVPGVGDRVCKYGAASGKRCGKVTKVTSHRIYITAFNKSGDSGGPVYIENDDGTVTAVGITSGIPAGECDADDECRGATVAELLAPWMRDWGLSF